MEVLLKIFQVSFFVGVGLSLISLIFGNLFDMLHLDASDIDLDVDVDGSNGLPFSPMIIIVFITVFGGIGVILSKTGNFPAAVIVLLAVAAGTVISYIIHHFIFRALKKAQNTSAPEEDELIGLPAKVNETIFKDGFGEITYLINGNSFVAPAKSVDGAEIKKGCEVSICWITEHIFFVTPFTVDLKHYDTISEPKISQTQKETKTETEPPAGSVR